MGFEMHQVHTIYGNNSITNLKSSISFSDTTICDLIDLKMVGQQKYKKL